MRVFVAATACLLFATAAVAQVPQRLGYQARLLKADGTPATGVLEISFAIFDTETGGKQFWSEKQKVGLSDGYYATFLGSASSPAGFPAGTFDGSERYLEISIGGEPLKPRQRVASVVYALMATDARNVVGGKVEATSISVNGTSVIDSTGKLAGSALAPCTTQGEVLRWTGTAWACALAAGPKGDTGAKGDTGPKGDVGPKGDPGPAGVGSASAPLAVASGNLSLTPCAAGQLYVSDGTSWSCVNLNAVQAGGYESVFWGGVPFAGTAAASTQASAQNAAEFAFDKSTATQWRSLNAGGAVLGDYLDFAFDSPRAIRTIVITNAAAVNTPVLFQVEKFVSGSPVIVYTTPLALPYSRRIHLTFAATAAATRWRLRPMAGLNASNPWIVSEMQMYERPIAGGIESVMSNGTATGGYTMEAAFDNAVSPGAGDNWGSSQSGNAVPGAAWIGYDFGVARSIRRIEIRNQPNVLPLASGVTVVKTTMCNQWGNCVSRDSDGNCLVGCAGYVPVVGDVTHTGGGYGISRPTLASYRIQARIAGVWTDVAVRHGSGRDAAKHVIDVPQTNNATAWRVMANSVPYDNAGWVVSDLDMFE